MRTGHAYALNSSGTVWRWDGNAWQQWQAVPDLQGESLGLAVVAADDLWVVGGDMFGSVNPEMRFMAHFNGQTWRTQVEPGETLHSIALTSPGHGWAVGDEGVQLALDGGTWRLLGYSWTTYGALSTVKVVPGANSALAVGNSLGQVIELSDTEVGFRHGINVGGRAPTEGVAPDGHGGAWTGGGRCVPDNCWATPPLTMSLPVPIVWHWDQNGRSRAEPLPVQVGYVSRLALRGPDDLWAVGGILAGDSPLQQASGFVLRRVGTIWRQVGGDTDVALNRLSFGTDGSGWATGHIGYDEPFEESVVLRVTDNDWQVHDRLAQGSDIRALKANAGDDVWIGGAAFQKHLPDGSATPHALLRHFDGQVWRDEPIAATVVTALDVQPSGHGWAGVWDGSRYKLFERSGGQWQPRQTIDASVMSLKLVSDDIGFAGTGQGQILRLADGAWSVDWSEPNRFTNLLMWMRDIAVLGWQGESPIIAVVGEPETLMVRNAGVRAYLPLASKLRPDR